MNTDGRKGRDRNMKETKEKERALQVTSMWLQWGKTTNRMPTETTTDVDQ